MTRVGHADHATSADEETRLRRATWRYWACVRLLHPRQAAWFAPDENANPDRTPRGPSQNPPSPSDRWDVVAAPRAVSEAWSWRAQPRCLADRRTSASQCPELCRR